MEFIAQPEVFARFPGLMLAVAVAYGIDNARELPAIEQGWRNAWQGALSASTYGNAQSHPRVRPWRQSFQAQDISGKEFPSSVEALLRRALKGGEPFRINPLVDLYNAISLRYYVPAGAFDLGEINGPLELRLTHLGDHFLALGAADPLDLPPGEVCYADGATILTRHFVWRQSRIAAITINTRDVFLVSEILGEVGREVAEAVRDEFESVMREHFGVASLTWIVNEHHPEARW
ncbi:MAG TPA: phenylalanine--tRNA ligase beta subunit-related protein [Ktedonobacterales bacterium]|nr:phenylalanine--tRNA ligase beta subunit-related protein [Ktedonobacterales bacterium]